MTTRHDASAVPAQGGYVAKQCPVRAQNDTIQDAQPIPVSEVLERRFRMGREFEADLNGELARLHPGVVVIDRGERGARESATAAAMADGAPLIIGGRLPADTTGRRVGEPDLLVAAPGGGYRAVDIKHHAATSPPSVREKGGSALCADLARPWLEDATTDPTRRGRKHKGDLLQLAHYQRMLEAAGLAAPDGRFAGIIGVEAAVVWHDLDAAIWRTPSSTGKQKLRSTMDVYEFEFDFRLDIIAVAQQHLADPAVKLLLVPVQIPECQGCPWWDVCRPQLEMGSGDVSLIARIGWREWKLHRDHGVTDRAALAALDLRTAQLMAAGVGVAGLLQEITGVPGATPLEDVEAVGARPAQLASLAAAGVITVADALTLSPLVASYHGGSSLPEQIDRARAALGPASAYRRRGLDALHVPRGDIEVDVDMENVEEGVYLWGALVTDRANGDHPSGYHAFATWEVLTPQEQARNFLAFWTWLSDLRSAAAQAGLAFRAYCYSQSAENRFLRECGAAAGVLDDVEAFIASEEWVDMLAVFDGQVITGGVSGLKSVAPLAGFDWDVEDPGGEASMLRYEEAVGASTPEERERATDWLLSYNRGDVLATLAIREWMAAGGEHIPPIGSLDERWN